MALARHPPIVKELAASIRAWINNRNDDPKPFIWHKTADEIFDSVAAFCQRMSDSGHQSVIDHTAGHRN